MAGRTGEPCMYCTRCDDLHERLDRFEEFFWENHVFPSCTYKHHTGASPRCWKAGCSAGLPSYCERDTCPVFRIKY
jgi:hypothetical protein